MRTLTAKKNIQELISVKKGILFQSIGLVVIVITTSIYRVDNTISLNSQILCVLIVSTSCVQS